MKIERAERSRQKRNERIIGGSDVTDSTSWPFIVNIGGVCGGSLISSQHVLTAGHCCSRDNFKYLNFYFGIRKLSEKNSAGQTRGVKGYKIHSDFSRDTLDNDLCVVLLDRPVELGFSVQPISLPRGNDQIFEKDFDGNVFIAGWGITDTSTGEVSDSLKNALVRFVPDGRCSSQSYYGNAFNATAHFCAGDDNTDACTFDSGGPAVVLKHRNYRLLENAKPGKEAVVAPHSAILASITSWGRGCARENKPGVYVRIESYLRNFAKFFR